MREEGFLVYIGKGVVDARAKRMLLDKNELDFTEIPIMTYY
jgi:hypothetical protein